MINRTHLSLKRLSITLLISLLLFTIAYGISTLYLSSQFSMLEDTWHDYRSQSNEKARLHKSMYAALGYGGMIHNFKNYVLRKDYETYVKLQRSLGAANTVVKQYVDLSTTTAEKLALEDIQTMLANYTNSVAIVRSGIDQGLTSREIDNQVRVNDDLALRGLNVLSEEIIREYDFFSDQRNKAVISSAMRKHIGFGGMIHAFKNYVLRGDETYKDQTEASLTDLQRLVEDFRQAGAKPGELVALQDISEMLKTYADKLEIVEQEIQLDTLPEDIDKQVKVSDELALRAFDIINRVNVEYLDNKSQSFTDTFNNIVIYEQIAGAVIASLVVLLAIFIYNIFSKQVIQPIRNISVMMEELAKGNLDVLEDDKTKDAEVSTELGRMEGALRIFKEHELDRRKAEEKIRQLALEDPLTGLANRNYFESRYEELEALARKEQKTIFLMAFDLDNFKPINDEFGHAAGDTVLKNVALRLVSTFRETDIVARIGGDEFFVAMYGPNDLDSVIEIVKRLLLLIPSPIPFGKDMLSVGVSIGILANLPDENYPLDVLMQRADLALYDAKQAGKNTFHIYEREEQIRPLSSV